MTTPAEERAEREDLPVVTTIVHELINAASGNPIIVSTTDGREVLLRLATVDEFIEMNAKGREYVRSLIGRESSEPPVSRERAAELVAPMRIPGWSRWS